jgi:hypothetical protein
MALSSIMGLSIKSHSMERRYTERHIFHCRARFRDAECCYAECCYAKCCYAECCYAECCYAECCYAECRYAECRHFQDI